LKKITNSTIPKDCSKYQILSDVDDTLLAGPPGGIDPNFPRAKLYPGVKKFHEIINDKVLTFLTARPDFVEDKSRSNLNRLLSRKVNVLSGNITDLVKTISRIVLGEIENLLSTIKNWFKDKQIEYNADRMDRFWNFAITKYENFRKFHQIYPEFEFIFIGDNQQGDIEAAMLMLQLSIVKPPKEIFPLKIVLIHNITFQTAYKFKPEEIEKYAANNIFFFNTYLDAFRILIQNLDDVMEETKVYEQGTLLLNEYNNDFYNLTRSYPNFNWTNAKIESKLSIEIFEDFIETYKVKKKSIHNN